MASITIKNLPSKLHERLKKRAERHHRSLNQEILATLEATVRAEPIDVPSFLERIRRSRPEGNERYTAEDFGAARNEGRP